MDTARPSNYVAHRLKRAFGGAVAHKSSSRGNLKKRRDLVGGPASRWLLELVGPSVKSDRYTIATMVFLIGILKL
jgi:hypothetical protein